MIRASALHVTAPQPCASQCRRSCTAWFDSSSHGPVQTDRGRCGQAARGAAEEHSVQGRWRCPGKEGRPGTLACRQRALLDRSWWLCCVEFRAFGVAQVQWGHSAPATRPLPPPGALMRAVGSMHAPHVVLLRAHQGSRVHTAHVRCCCCFCSCLWWWRCGTRLGE